MGYKLNPFTGKFDEVGAGSTTSPGGSDTEIQFNDAGAFDGSPDLTWDDTGKVLGVGGDIDLDDGGTYTTTLQTITPTAARTISFPDATGTVGLVGGSSGNLVVNQSGAYAGVANSSVDNATGNITLGSRFISSLNGAASAPPGTFTGTWFTGGTATTTKPQVVIEPTGATSTAWSTSGTGFGVNAASGFAGNLLDLQTNGTSRTVVTGAGNVGIGNSTPENKLVVVGLSSTGAGGTNNVAEFAGPSRTNGFQIFVSDANNNSGIQAKSADAFLINPNGGNVGIGVASSSSLLHLADAGNITVGTTTGTKIGTATSQKLGFWNVTPVIQPASADQAALGAVTTVGTNTGTPGAGLSLIGDTQTTDQSAALMNDLAALREDLAAAFTLINQLRTDLAAVGLIKGAA
jgi:hypothetical protein